MRTNELCAPTSSVIGSAECVSKNSLHGVFILFSALACSCQNFEAFVVQVL